MAVRYFQLLKLVGTRKLLVVRSREVAVPERLLYIEVIVVSVLGCFIAGGCSLEVAGGSTVVIMVPVIELL